MVLRFFLGEMYPEWIKIGIFCLILATWAPKPRSKEDGFASKMGLAAHGHGLQTKAAADSQANALKGPPRWRINSRQLHDFRIPTTKIKPSLRKA